MKVMNQNEISETVQSLSAGNDVEVVYEVPNGDWRHITGTFAERSEDFITLFVGNDVAILRISTIVDLENQSPTFEAVISPIDYDSEYTFIFGADFRTDDDLDANRELVAEVTNNFDSKAVLVDVEMSRFYAYAETAADMDRFAAFMVDLFADKGAALVIDEAY